MTPDTVILAALRNERVPWPGDDDRLGTGVLDCAADHGVSPLLARAAATGHWPDHLRAGLASRCRAAAAVDAVRHQHLVRLLETLSSAGIDALVVKGAQLAFTHYPHSWLRPRLDTDLLVDPSRRSAADAVLRGLGYRPATHFDGALVTHQFQYRLEDRLGIEDRVDLHWRIANPHVFADTFTFAELARASRPISSLGHAAHGLSDAHALMLACMHRVAHHANSTRLLWLYDIHLLVEGMTPSARETAGALARQRGLGTVCATGIALAADRFGTNVSRQWLEGLETDDAASAPARAFLRTGRTRVDDLVSDLRALRGWRSRLRLLVEHALPPAAYIRHAYGVQSAPLTALAYLHRLFGGAAWFRPDRDAP